MSRTNVAKRKKKDPLEFFATNPLVTKGLLSCPFVHLPLDGPWLEPCAGDGAIIKAVTEFYGERAPVWDAVDIDRSHAEALRQTPNIERVLIQDARTLSTKSFSPHRRWRVCLTNPAFSIAGPVLAAVRPLADYTVMLLRVGWFEAKHRYQWLSRDMPDQGTLNPRPSFRRKGSDSAVYGWFLWTPERRMEARFFLVPWRDGMTSSAQGELL